MERTLDLSSVEVHDVEITEAGFPDAIEFRIEGVVTDLDDDRIEEFVGKELRPKSITFDTVEEGAS